MALDGVLHPGQVVVAPEPGAEHGAFDTGDIPKLKTLSAIARELIEDRPLDELFGFIVERVLLHTQASRAAIGLIASDGKSFMNVEVRRQDKADESELRISRTVLASMIQEKKALAFVDVNVDSKLSRVQSIVGQGIRSMICAPLTVADDVVGVLYIDYLFAQRQISEEDVRLVAQIARFAAIKLETASVIQRRLLPPAPTGIAGYTFAGANRPCRTVSGDYYDFVVRPDKRVYFVIADVSGKGVTAGLMMAGLQASFRIFCKGDPRPADLVTELNGAMKETLPQSKFVTLFVGRLDTETGIIEYANAGHTPPLWVRKKGVEEVADTDVLLGVVTRAIYRNRTLELAPGDSLVLFTDGLTEAENADGEDLQSTEFARRLSTMHGAAAEEVTQAVELLITEHTAELPLADDVTLVVVSRNRVDELAMVVAAAEEDATLVGG